MSEADPLTTLSDAELQRLLDRFGSDTAKWPAPSAQAAERLLAGSPAAARELEAARALDGWLAGLREHRAPDDLAAAIMARIDGPDRADRVDRTDRVEQFARWLTGRLWRPVLIGALPLVAGFALGFALPEPADADLAGQLGTLAFVDIYAELNDADQP